MRFIYAFLFTLCFSTAHAQLDSLFKGLIISECDSNNIKPLSQSMADFLPDRMVYLKGEIHSIKSNSTSFRSLFLGLHEKKGVNYILCELNHSYCFALNLVLKTGDATVLAEFDKKTGFDSVSLKRYYRYILTLYNYNLKQSPENKISFIGIDYDLQNTNAKANVQYEYQTAIKYLKRFSIKPLPGEIEYLCNEILKASDYAILRDLSSRLKDASAMHVSELIASFGDLYKDYYLIVNSVKYFPGIFREREMLTNFNYAVEGIKKVNPDTKPKFFGSFGAAHVEAGSNSSFAAILNKSKGFKDQVSFIATGYYNCLSTYDEKRPVIWQGAPIFGLKKKDQVAANSLVKAVSESTRKSLILMGGFKGLPADKLDFLKPYDALLIYNNFNF